MVFENIPNSVIVGIFTLLGAVSGAVISALATYYIVKREQEGENQRLIASVRDERKVNSLLELNEKIDDFYRLIMAKRTEDVDSFSYEDYQEVLDEFRSVRNAIRLFEVWFPEYLSTQLENALDEFGLATRYFEWMWQSDLYRSDEPPKHRNPDWGDIEEAYEGAKEALRSELSGPIETLKTDNRGDLS